MVRGGIDIAVECGMVDSVSHGALSVSGIVGERQLCGGTRGQEWARGS